MSIFRERTLARDICNKEGGREGEPPFLKRVAFQEEEGKSGTEAYLILGSLFVVGLRPMSQKSFLLAAS